MNSKKKLSVLAITGLSAASLLLAAPAFAQSAPAAASTTPAPRGGWAGGRMGGMMAPGVSGKVTAISGNSITITSTARGPKTSTGTAATPTTTTYTVNATSATVTKNGSASSLSGIAVGDQIMVQGTVSGTTVTATKINDGMMGMGMMGRGVNGTVASVSGTTLTVTTKAGPKGTPAAATYTVNAASAAVTKAGATSSVGAIAVGDTVMVQGTVSGTTVTATKINDGIPQPAAPVITGNGEPIIAGTIASISGSTLTVTNKSGITYTVDASNAKVQKGNALSTLASVASGDSVVVQGTVNGTSVSAYSVIDQGAAPTASGTGTTGVKSAARGILGSIGNFFSRLFGF